MSVPQAASTLTAEVLLARLSDHLDGLAAEVHRVEQVVGKQALAAPAVSSGSIVQLQSLDYLRQSLEDLSLLTLFLGRPDRAGLPGWQCPEQFRSRMRLGSTRALFDQAAAPSPQAPHPEVNDSDVGDLDLF